MVLMTMVHMKHKYRKIDDEVWFADGQKIGRGKIVGIHIDIEKDIIFKNVQKRYIYDVAGMYDTGIFSGIIHKDVIICDTEKEACKAAFH